MSDDAERIGRMAVAGSGSQAIIDSRPHSQGAGGGGMMSAGQFGNLLGGGGEAAAGAEAGGGLEALALLAL